MITLEKIAGILGCVTFRRLPISSYTSDSRECGRGALFFALKGERVDGHHFLPEVAAAGAFAAVVSLEYRGPDYGLELLRVPDVLESLQYLARAILRERRTRIIGITGSVGKTTTKDYIAALLEKKFRIFKTPGSRNTQVTLPLTILHTKGDEEFLVLEMGMTHKGNIANLVKIAPPEIVVLTPIVIAHAEFHKDVNEIALAKCEIFTEYAEFAVIHEVAASRKPVAELCNCPHVIYPSDIDIKPPFPETHLIEDFMGACEVALYLGMTKEEIRERLPYVKGSPRRFEKKRHKGVLYVDDSYNANPTSTIAALMNLPKPKEGGRVIFAFGSMGELGEYSRVSHTEVGKFAAERVDHFLCIGKETEWMLDSFVKRNKSATQYNSQEEMKVALWELVRPGDVVLVKGSKSHKMWELLEPIGVDE